MWDTTKGGASDVYAANFDIVFNTPNNTSHTTRCACRSASILTPRTAYYKASLSRTFCPYIKPREYSEAELGLLSDLLKIELEAPEGSYLGTNTLNVNNGLFKKMSYSFDSASLKYIGAETSLRTNELLVCAVVISFVIAGLFGLLSIFIIMHSIIYAYSKFMSFSEFELRYKDIITSMSKGAALNKKDFKRAAELKKANQKGNYLERKLR